MKTPGKSNNRIFGTLYHRDMFLPHRTVYLNKGDTSKLGKKQILGAGITSLAMAVFLNAYGPVVSSNLASITPQRREEAGVVKEAVASNAIPQTKETTIPTSNEFSINIPAISASSIIVPNVPTDNEAEYEESLKEGVAHAAGTGLPGSGKRIFLFAHSTNSPLFFKQFNAVFYELHRLEIGERVIINYNGKVYTYSVSEKVIAKASDAHWLRPENNDELILQTCYPPGTAWKRLLVIARPI